MWITMLSVFLIYNLIILLKYGWLNSISVSYYSLPAKWNFIFTLFCFGYAIPAVIMAKDGFMFFSGCFICFVGIACNFRQDLITADTHNICSFIAILLSQLSILFFYHFWWLNIITVMSTLILYMLRNKFSQWMYVLEWIAFLTVAYTLK